MKAAAPGDPRRTTHEEQHQLIQALIEERPYRTRELAGLLELTAQKAIELLRQLEALGRVQRSGIGKGSVWRLVDRREQRERRQQERRRLDAEADAAVERREAERRAADQAGQPIDGFLAVHDLDRATTSAPPRRSVLVDGVELFVVWDGT